MHAEVISIGDEMASGQTLDTNSQWLSQRLGERGITVLYHTTVADDLAANVRVFRTAIERADIIVITGGLGPTADDLTRQALAETVGVDLVQDDVALAAIQALFDKRQREMPAANVVQAQFPRGSRVIPNPHGTAPGIDLTTKSAAGTAVRLFALPGVPAEMKEMWALTVGPEIEKIGGGKVILHHRLKCFGVGESDLEAMLPDLIRRGRQPSVGITVSKATITLRITAEGTSVGDCRTQMEPTIATIHASLGDLVFGEEEDELQDAVAKLLLARGETLAVVEWGTAGLIAHWLGECDAGHVMRGALLVRDREAAMGFAEAAAESDMTALMSQLAQSCRGRFGTTYALAIGPFPAAAAPAGVGGNVDFLLAEQAGTLHKTALFTGHPEILKPRAAKQALNFLRLHLLAQQKTPLTAKV